MIYGATNLVYKPHVTGDCSLTLQNIPVKRHIQSFTIIDAHPFEFALYCVYIVIPAE